MPLFILLYVIPSILSVGIITIRSFLYQVASTNVECDNSPTATLLLYHIDVCLSITGEKENRGVEIIAASEITYKNRLSDFTNYKLISNEFDNIILER